MFYICVSKLEDKTEENLHSRLAILLWFGILDFVSVTRYALGDKCKNPCVFIGITASSLVWRWMEGYFATFLQEFFSPVIFSDLGVARGSSARPHGSSRRKRDGNGVPHGVKARSRSVGW